MSEPRRSRIVGGPADATVVVPGSKSIANRMLVAAALAHGTSEITNVPDGDDTEAMLTCLAELGVGVRRDDTTVSVAGSGGQWTPGEHRLFAGLAGTTSRFVTALAALGSAPITVDGQPPLRQRPFGPLHDALGQLGVDVQAEEAAGGLPATIIGPPTSGVARIPGDVSSQYVTALMLVGPYLPGGLDLELTTPLVSRPYVEITAATIGWFGVDDVVVTDDRVRVGAGRYVGRDVVVEPDASSASYPLALAALIGGGVTVPGLGTGAIQGDAVFADLLGRMGCTVRRTPDGVTVVGTGVLHGIDVDMADISDLVPTVAVVAAFADTPTRIRGVGFIRKKESDRLGDLVAELRRVGIDADETSDGLLVRPSRGRIRPARLSTHHDHRLAMAFGLLGSAVDGLEIEDPAVVSKSWPRFWDMLDESFP